jgi:hypothetical protein
MILKDREAPMTARIWVPGSRVLWIVVGDPCIPSATNESAPTCCILRAILCNTFARALCRRSQSYRRESLTERVVGLTYALAAQAWQVLSLHRSHS